MKADKVTTDHVFAETLEALLSEKRNEMNDKEFCDAAKIPTSSLGDYRNGTVPRLDAFVRMARTLKVSLDQLAFGKHSTPAGGTTDPALYEYLNRSITDVHVRQLRYMQTLEATMSTFTKNLTKEVALAADKYTTHAGILLDDDLAKIEECSIETRLIRLGLDYFSSDTQGARQARQGSPSPKTSPKAHVLRMLAVNLNRPHPRKYAYFLPRLPEETHDWKEEVKQRIVDPLIHAHGVKVERIRDNCKFYETDMSSVAGCILYRVRTEELAAIQDTFPAMLLEKDFVLRGKEQWIGFTLPPKPDCQVNLLMEETHLQNALRVTDTLAKAPSTKQIEVA